MEMTDPPPNLIIYCVFVKICVITCRDQEDCGERSWEVLTRYGDICEKELRRLLLQKLSPSPSKQRTKKLLEKLVAPVS
jgi:hypothetical protein